ncbi:MAG: glycosyltransferase [Bacilli bacterium]
MKKNPKVTIVIPVYNGSNYVKEAIDSALAQTYKNIEIIVVNDGSNDEDKTRNIALSYGDKITYIEKENGGVSTALNLAINKMTGDYFSWLSHDDLYLEDKVESQIKEIQKYDDKTILYSDFRLIDLNGNILRDEFFNHEMLQEKPKYCLLRGAIIGITLLIPRQAFIDCGNFDTSLKCTQDFDLWHKMSLKYNFVHMNKIISCTRIHPSQDSVKHPNVIFEGDNLWTKMALSLPEELMIKYENSKINYLIEMINYLSDFTPYKGAIENITIELNNQIKKEKSKSITCFIKCNNNLENVLKTIENVKNQEIILVGNTFEQFNKKYKNIKQINEKMFDHINTESFMILDAGTLIDKENLITANKFLIASNQNALYDKSSTFYPSSTIIFAERLTLINLNSIIYLTKKNKSLKFNNEISLAYNAVRNSIRYYKKIIETTLINKMSFNDTKKILELYLKEENVCDKAVASIAYRCSVNYNKENTFNKKVYMEYNCDNYNLFMTTRSFKIAKKISKIAEKIRTLKKKD